MSTFILLTAATWLAGLFMVAVTGSSMVCLVIPVCVLLTYFWYQLVFGEHESVRTSYRSSYIPDDGDEEGADADPFRLDSNGVPKDPITKWWLYNELLEQQQRDQQSRHDQHFR